MDKMKPTDKTGGTRISNAKGVMILGFVLSFIAALYCIIGYLDIASDASTSAFAFLVLIEGGVFVLLGLVLMLIGYRMHIKTDKNH